MNVMLVWDLFPFPPVITLLIPISSAALRGNTSAARFEFIHRVDADVQYIENRAQYIVIASIYFKMFWYIWNTIILNVYSG